MSEDQYCKNCGIKYNILYSGSKEYCKNCYTPDKIMKDKDKKIQTLNIICEECITSLRSIAYSFNPMTAMNIAKRTIDKINFLNKS